MLKQQKATQVENCHVDRRALRLAEIIDYTRTEALEYCTCKDVKILTLTNVCCQSLNMTNHLSDM